MKNEWSTSGTAPSPSCSLQSSPWTFTNICLGQLLLNNRPIRTRCRLDSFNKGGILRRAEEISFCRSWSLKLFLAGLFCLELLRRIKQQADQPASSLPLGSLPSPPLTGSTQPEKCTLSEPQHAIPQSRPGSKEFFSEGLADPERRRESGAQGQF